VYTENFTLTTITSHNVIWLLCTTQEYLNKNSRMLVSWSMKP